MNLYELGRFRFHCSKLSSSFPAKAGRTSLQPLFFGYRHLFYDGSSLHRTLVLKIQCSSLRGGGTTTKQSALQNSNRLIIKTSDCFVVPPRNDGTYKSCNATLFQFAIIGETIVHIANEILVKYKYPWHKVRSFRNFILHEYHNIEFRIVWEAVKKDLPELKQKAGTILKNEF
jgi:hypothetical protein